MKKLFFIAIAACTTYAANAQIVMPKGPITKIPKSIVPVTPSVVVSRTTGNYPEVTMRVVVSVEDVGEKGFKVNFQSSIPLEKVEISMSEPKQEMNTLFLGEDQSSGYIFIDAPVYKGSNTYLLRFYAPGYPKGMWSAAIQRKVS